MIAQESVDAIKASMDIIDTVSSYVELKKVGSNYKAPCPFHDENSPSFVVSPAKQIYHCFGCGVTGDAIKFVQEYEKLSYPEALEKIGDMVNVDVKHISSVRDTRGYEILEHASRWYHHILPQVSTAQAYLRDRGVSQESIEHWNIGYAPQSKRTINYIKENLFSPEDAIDTGIIGEDGGRQFARFIERITFPIRNANGKVVGFGGRTISDHPAKYVNTAQGKYYNKSRILYGYHEAKQTIFKRRAMILTEGYLDVVMMHQADIKTAVATCGTALTLEHIPLIKRSEARVIIAYDGDKAGRSAALKAARLCGEHKIDGGVVLWPEGKDPADMIKEGREQEVKQMLSRSIDMVEFVLLEICAGLNDPRAKESALKEAEAYLHTLGPIHHEHHRGRMAEILGISPHLLQPLRPVIPEMPINDRSVSSSSVEDIAMLQFLKGLCEFESYRQTAEMIMGDLADGDIAKAIKGEALSHVLVRDDIEPMGEHHFRAQLSVLRNRFAQKRIEAISSDESMDFARKQFEITKLRLMM